MHSTNAAAGYGGKLKASALDHDGFVQGALETFQLTHKAFATSWAAVFRTTTGATHAFAAETAEFSGTPSAGGKPATTQTFAVDAIPGAIGRHQTLTSPNGHLYEVEVSFTAGRCLLDLTLGRFSRNADVSTRALEDAAITGATALDRRVRHVCV